MVSFTNKIKTFLCFLYYSTTASRRRIVVMRIESTSYVTIHNISKRKRNTVLISSPNSGGTHVDTTDLCGKTNVKKISRSKGTSRVSYNVS
jgi:Ser-tRNA(Ala) deacylase AlaX